METTIHRVAGMRGRKTKGEGKNQKKGATILTLGAITNMVARTGIEPVFQP
jgi:hypothetical protein